MPVGEESVEPETITFPVSGRPLVSILIPSRNQAALLESCLRSLRKNLGEDVSYEIIIVLNAATEEVKSLVRNRTRGLTILESAANLGVAGGYNRARAAARGDYLLLLHDDVEIEPNWIEPLVETLATRPAAGAVGSLQFFPDGRPQRAGSILWQNSVTTTPWGGGTPDPRIFTEIRPVDYVGTCSTLVRAATWDAAGGMDEEIYPAYFVDVDLCMQVRRLGQTVLCNPASRVKHHQWASTDKKFRTFIHLRNQTYFVKKWADELVKQEPYVPDDPDSIARATQRTENRATGLTEDWKGLPQPSTPSGFRNPAAQELAHFKKELAVFSEYQKHLETVEDHLNDLLIQTGADLAIARETEANQQAEIILLRKRCSALKSKLRRIKNTLLQRIITYIKKRFGAAR